MSGKEFVKYGILLIMLLSIIIICYQISFQSGYIEGTKDCITTAQYCVDVLNKCTITLQELLIEKVTSK